MVRVFGEILRFFEFSPLKWKVINFLFDVLDQQLYCYLDEEHKVFVVNNEELKCFRISIIYHGNEFVILMEIHDNSNCHVHQYNNQV